ncbi:PREDICTED: uncharacterized protein LOC108619715 [Drosophila arizonae]|uniref:Uncharacterized protein LOC108619715 n=1 Tax=Drosophila arizonae TaxID=7263 RepID=A0ABM1PXK7_DROAR|nr:PREDICTED: uncharacterized protein LOC108619715 [Drosophila arizonae]
MHLNMIKLRDVHLMSCLIGGSADEDKALQFCCHDQRKELSYTENLPVADFLQRIKQLNKRVEFPAEAVRTALSSAQPAEATFRAASQNGAEQQQELNQDEQLEQRTVLSLKYRIEGTPAPLKWEWHLTSTDSVLLTFYRHMLKNALYTAASLSKNVHYLLDIVKKKDIEVQQYRRDGARHWRTTVATEPFDVEAFSAQNHQLLSAVAAFEPDDLKLDDIPTATSTIKSESAGCSTNVAAKCLSPRNRKRKAMETGKQHVERKVLQRRRVPQLQYKSSESQESELDAMFGQIKAESVKAEVESMVAGIKEETSPDDEVAKTELDEIMQLINRTEEQTKQILEEHQIA